LRLYRKEGATVQIIGFPNEEVGKGDYLTVEDRQTGKSLIIQVIDVQYANVPGLLEELLRDHDDMSYVQGEDLDPLDVATHIAYIQDARLLICKTRASSNNGELISTSSWLPPRSSSAIKKLSTEKLLDHSGADGYLVHLGESMEEKQFHRDGQKGNWQVPRVQAADPEFDKPRCTSGDP
jgi:hypothetical protein